MKNMKFDVIIGNPPYQLNDGGHGASAIPLYHRFVQQAKQFNPKYISMIIPSRWFSGGRGLDQFRIEMLNDTRLKVLVDYIHSKECFPNNEIKGGICYFLWDRDYKGDCEVTEIRKGNCFTLTRPLLEAGQKTFIRYNQAIPILHKVLSKNEVSFSQIISSQNPFGLRTFFIGRVSPKPNDIKIYGNKNVSYLTLNELPKNHNLVDTYKLFVPYAIGSGDMATDWVKPIKSVHGEACTETYIIFGPFNNESEMNHAYTYTQTKFFHFMLGLKKISQHTTPKVYEFVPIQDFSKSWTDQELYEKYGLTPIEINYIESMVRPMGIPGLKRK